MYSNGHKDSYSKDKYMINYEDLKEIFNDYGPTSGSTSNTFEYTVDCTDDASHLDYTIIPYYTFNGSGDHEILSNIGFKPSFILIKDDNEYNDYVDDLFKDIEDVL